MRIVFVISVLVLLFVPAVGKSSVPLTTANEANVNGVWESLDFDTGVYYRLDIDWPRVVLIMTAGYKERGEYRFDAERPTLREGAISVLAKDEATGLRVVMSGKIRANGSTGRADISVRLDERDEKRFFGKWKGGPLRFLKRAGYSRTADLARAEKRADELATKMVPTTAPAPKSAKQK